jgi:hypothetical protein
MAESHVFDPTRLKRWLIVIPHTRACREHHPCFHIEAGDYWVLSRLRRCRGKHCETTLVSHLRRHRPRSCNQSKPHRLRPPDHNSTPRLVSRVFVPKAISGASREIEGHRRRQLDHILQFGSCDLVERLCRSASGTVIAEMMGVSPQYHADFKRWSDLAMEALAVRHSPRNAPRKSRAGKRVEDGFSSFKDVVAERRGQRVGGYRGRFNRLQCSDASDDERLSPSGCMGVLRPTPSSQGTRRQRT